MLKKVLHQDMHGLHGGCHAWHTAALRLFKMYQVLQSKQTMIRQPASGRVASLSVAKPLETKSIREDGRHVCMQARLAKVGNMKGLSRSLQSCSTCPVMTIEA